VGEPPQEKWPTILNNAREKARAEAIQPYQAFSAYNPQELQGIATLAQAIATDPVQAIALQLQAMEGRPESAQALRSLAAKVLGTRVQAPAQTAAPETDAMPEADLQTADGMAVYSAAQQAKLRAWDRRQAMAEMQAAMDERLQPLRSVTEAVEKERATVQADKAATEAFRPFEADPDFKAHAPAVKALIESDPKLFALAGSDPAMALETAWARVYRRDVLPARDKATESKVLASLQQRAAASSLNPGGARPSTPKSTLGDAYAALRATGE
jgi:hypothetical protein